MTKKDKFLVVILTIFTLGFCWLYWYLKNKKHQQILTGKQQITLSQNKVDELISLLGGKQNISDVSASGSRLFIVVDKKDLVKANQIMNNKLASGVFMSSNKITLIMGEYAQTYAQQLTNN
ncbi:PTS sugar transporter subunit IIA [Mycoplasmopsis phocirhinis]|uniref:PTS sugar transporter subunit IIA n=1 Tax=Mycoplasmopsis phocirhinis TaxID=142650 RepID=A0A4P6MT86_9BACT|nr:PTS sugar transporter subunit IIA [Mycoplasmopsis phocirhinis]QBF34537.1 PTS sugar transporter subunit IIA [Mycoplasmopsis phocirhinis]